MYNAYLMNWAQFYNKKGINKNGIDMNSRDGVSSNWFDGDEVVAYMMPRILEAPLPSEWVNIYTWYGLQFAKTFEKTGRILAMEEVAPQQLSNYEKVLLQKLRVWIYEKRRQALRDKLKATKRSRSQPFQ